ncbi:MAG: ribbon-helix-helix protein, CopG family [Acidobacteria bacterium]|nr:ribbon-helix-helix protein, CopG family [Acidobacteriota bacterium]
MSRPTSFRLPEDLLARLEAQARAEGRSVSGLASSMLNEAVKTRLFPGIVYRPGPTGRRAAVAGGPDVWELVRAVKEATGYPKHRIAHVSKSLGISAAALRLAIDFYTSFPDEIDQRIAEDERAAEHVRDLVARRERLLRSSTAPSPNTASS